ncbi:MAG: hypothetical protein HY289_15775 [Planctomycetes bacterium]|nr:hypothetical protein [Planctomycetota bacterium]
MNHHVNLAALLKSSRKSRPQQLALFALLNLGMIESLSNGALGAADALRLFYHADNCLFVRNELRDKTADEVMSRAVQLADLFDILPTEAARREFQHELATMRGLCLKLLEKKRLVA